MFRLQNNVPPVYVEESRDFQLILRVMDLLNDGIRFDIQSMINLINPIKIKSEFLNLYATKVGFFPKRPINEETLRYILAAYPYLIRNKGTVKAIECAVATVLKAERQPDAVKEFAVNIVNKDADGEPVYQVQVYVPVQMTYNRIALEELLANIVPTGYDVTIMQYTQQPGRVLAQIKTVDDVSDRVFINTVKTSGVRGYLDYIGTQDGVKKTLTGAYDVGEVVSNDYYNKMKDEDEYGEE